MVELVRTLKTSEAAAVLNVSPNTLRAWERRFGYPKPQRTAGKHRLYTHGEVAALKLYVSGLSTTDVADRMNVQYETAKTYLRRVREKYAKANRPASKKSDLIRRAAEDGYLR